jgi:hypothetical protein
MAILRLGPVLITRRLDREASAFRFSPYKRPVKQVVGSTRPGLCSEEESDHSNSHGSDLDGTIQVSERRLSVRGFGFEKIDPDNPLSDHIQGLGTKAEPFYFLSDNSAVKVTRNDSFPATEKSHPADDGEHLGVPRKTSGYKYPSSFSEGAPFFTSIYNLNFVKTFDDLPLNLFDNNISEITGDVPYLRFSGPFKDGHIIGLEERRYCCSPEPISSERGSLDDTQNIVAAELEDLVRTSPK